MLFAPRAIYELLLLGLYCQYSVTVWDSYNVFSECESTGILWCFDILLLLC